MAYALGGLGTIDFIRGGIHWLAPDGGAGSIAGMNLANVGGPNIVFCSPRMVSSNWHGQVCIWQWPCESVVFWA
jgi:hypothetical protein